MVKIRKNAECYVTSFSITFLSKSRHRITSIAWESVDDMNQPWYYISLRLSLVKKGSYIRDSTHYRRISKNKLFPENYLFIALYFVRSDTVEILRVFTKTFIFYLLKIKRKQNHFLRFIEIILLQKLVITIQEMILLWSIYISRIF